MKKIFGYLIVAGVSFVAGGAAGWFARKKTSEIQFEVVDIQQDEGDGDGDGDAGQNPVSVPPEKVMETVQETIDRRFDGPGEGEKALDTQKEQYFKKWKADAAIEQYDTRTKEDPENPVISEEEDLEEGFDKEFLENAAEEAEHTAKTGKEAASIEDWDHWYGISDGDYDALKIYWFIGDNVLTDEDGSPLEKPGKFLGFDVAQKFDEISPETTGDPDIRVIYNHDNGSIFQIIRRQGSYARRKGMEEFGSDYEDDEGQDE